MRSKVSLKCRAAALLVVAYGATAMSCPAAAQSAPVDESADTVDNGDIIVTATRRETKALEVPGGITALGQDLVEKTGAQNLSDVIGAAPGVSLSKNSTTEQIYTIRGVNTTSGSANQQSPTALYVGEVPISDPYFSLLTPSLQLFDVNRVEILLGPQGTLFGAGSLGGAIRIIPNQPNSARFESTLEAMVSTQSAGNIGYGANIMVNAPLVTDKLALRLVGSYAKQGGYIDNPGLEERNYNSGEVLSGRAQLAWQVTPDFKVTATGTLESARPDGAPYTPYGSREYVYSSLVRNRAALDTGIFNLLAEYVGDSVSFTSSSSYLRRDPNQTTDISALATAITGLTTPSTNRITGRTENLVQEFRVASRGGSRFNWLVGLYLQHYTFDETEATTQPGAGALFEPIGFPSDVILIGSYAGKVDEAALYGEASYDIGDKLTATVGLRAFHDRVSVTQIGEGVLNGGPTADSNSAKYSGITPKFVLSFKPIEEVMVYAQAAKGFRAGQANVTPRIDPISGNAIPRSYDPDQLWNYEVGVKASALDRTLTINAAGYYIDWSKIQLQQRSTAGFQFTANAGEAWIKGISLSLQARPSRAFEAGFSFDYHKSKLTDVLTGVAAAVGDKLPGSAPFTANLYGQFNLDLGSNSSGFFRADYSYTDKAFSELNNRASLVYGDVSELGASVGFTFDRVELSLYGKNLLDNRGRTAAFQILRVPTQVLQLPRSFGAILRFRY